MSVEVLQNVGVLNGVDAPVTERKTPSESWTRMF